jgi:uncharacterized membrane protein YdbT with pleckstrin-like domain
MRTILPWMVVFTIIFVFSIVYIKYKTTTYRNADGSCQSLTIEDDCD